MAAVGASKPVPGLAHGDSSTIPPGLAASHTYPRSPWLFSKSLFERLKKLEAAEAPRTFTACTIERSDPEYNFVLQYFNHTKPAGRAIRSMRAIYNPGLTQGYVAMLRSIEARAPKLRDTWKEEAPIAQREKTMKRWEAQVAQFSPIHIKSSKRTDVLTQTYNVPLWHATARADDICADGFAISGKHHLVESSAKVAKAGTFASTDLGFFGSAAYLTNSVRYAAMYYPETVLLAWGCMGKPYPVVSDFPIPKKATDMTKLEGQGGYQHFTTHFIPVHSAYPKDPTNMIYHPCFETEVPECDEYAFFSTFQVLPYICIDLGIDFPAAPSTPTTVQTLLDLVLKLVDNPQIEQDADLNALLSSKAETLLSTDAADPLSPQDQEFFRKVQRLVSPEGTLSRFIKQSLLAKPSGAPKEKLEYKKPAPVEKPSALAPAKPALAPLTGDEFFVLSGEVKDGDAEALRLLRMHAEAGEAGAQSYLGFTYRYGLGVAKDEREAMKWYKMAAAQGDAEAESALKELSSLDENEKESPLVELTKDQLDALFKKADEEALRTLRSHAEAGEPAAQSTLGEVFEQGKGVLKDESQAFQWYQKVAEQGFAREQCWLGEMCEHGKGVTKDINRAIHWYRLAAAQENADAESALKRLTAQDSDVTKPFAVTLTLDQHNALYLKAQKDAAALRTLRTHAEAGEVEAQYNLGLIYSLGLGTVENKPEGDKWFKLAIRGYKLLADQGDVHACHNLAMMFSSGQGVTEDKHEAARWSQLAAERGHAPSQYYLGLGFEVGSSSGGKDIEMARYWYGLAAKQGHTEAEKHLKNLASSEKVEHKKPAIVSAAPSASMTSIGTKAVAAISAIDLKKQFPKLEIFDGSVWETHANLTTLGLHISDEPPLNVSLIPFLKTLFASWKIEDDAGITILTLPAGLTLRKLAKVAVSPKCGNPTKLEDIWENALKALGDVPVERTYRVAITNNVLKGSRKLSVNNQSSLQESGGTLPGVLPVAALSILTFISSKISFFKGPTRLYGNKPLTYTYTNEKVDGQTLVVGGFLNGPTITHPLWPGPDIIYEKIGGGSMNRLYENSDSHSALDE